MANSTVRAIVSWILRILGLIIIAAGAWGFSGVNTESGNAFIRNLEGSWLWLIALAAIGLLCFALGNTLRKPPGK